MDLHSQLSDSFRWWYWQSYFGYQPSTTSRHNLECRKVRILLTFFIKILWVKFAKIKESKFIAKFKLKFYKLKMNNLKLQEDENLMKPPIEEQNVAAQNNKSASKKRNPLSSRVKNRKDMINHNKEMNLKLLKSLFKRRLQNTNDVVVSFFMKHIHLKSKSFRDYYWIIRNFEMFSPNLKIEDLAQYLKTKINYLNLNSSPEHASHAMYLKHYRILIRFLSHITGINGSNIIENEEN